MKTIIVSFIALLALSCTTPKSDSLTWTFAEIKHDTTCNMSVDLKYPVFAGDSIVSVRINTYIDSLIKSGIELWTALDKNMSIAQQVEKVYAEKRVDTVMRPINLVFNSESSVYSIGEIVSVYIAKIYYQGGAHGNDVYYYLNFLKSTGELVPNDKLFSNSVALLKLTRNAFYKERNLTGLETQENSGMFIAPMDLPLPENIGFDSTGVAMVYNYYEVGPRSFGLTYLSIPMKEVKDIVSDYAK